MAAPVSEPGRYSLSGSDIVRPVPADSDDVFKKVGSKYPRASRSQSTGNMLGAIQDTLEYPKYGPQHVHHEPSERNNLRDLAKFFRTAAPSASHAPSGSGSGSEHRRKRSIQSMIKRRRPSKRATQSLQLPPLDKIIAKKPTEGYPYADFELPHPPNTDELWAQSQYPVITDTTSRPVPRSLKWPARTTSRGALSPTTSPTHTFSIQRSGRGLQTPEPIPEFSDLQRSPRPLANRLSGPSDEDLKNFTEARLLAANFLRTLAEQSTSCQDPEPEHLGPSLIPSSDSKSHRTKVDFPVTPPPSGQLQQFEWPQVLVNSAAASPAASPKASRDVQRQRSLSSMHTRLTSPKSSGSLKRPLNIAVQNSLAIPDQSVLPESPGFPRMLAGMTFPSPPRSSRSASPASTLSLMIPTPPKATSGPTIRPRASSKNALTTSYKSSSLDEIAMLPSRPEMLRSKPSLSLRGSSSMEQTAKPRASDPEPSFKAEVAPAEKDAELPHSEDLESSGNPATAVRSRSKSSFVTADEEHDTPRAPSAMSDTESHRQSVSSISTTIREFYRQSTSTNNTNRQSTRSNETTVSTAPSVRDEIMRKSHEMSSIQLVEKMPSPTGNIEGPPPEDRSSIDCGDLNSSRPSAAIGNAVHKPLSIAERRMARNGLPGECRERSVTLNRPGSMPGLRNVSSLDSIDSPVLGWFPHSNRPARKMSIHGPSPLAQISEPLSANPSPGTVGSRAGAITQDVPQPASKGLDAPTISATPVVKKVENGTWDISPIMATSIGPEKPSQPLSNAATSSFSISPMIVVASLEPEQAKVLPQRQRGSISSIADAQAPPNLPAKSPRRPKYVSRRLSRQIQLPVKVPPIPTSSPDAPTGSNVSPAGRSIFMAPSALSQSKAFKRLSLPIYVTPSSAQPTSWGRNPSSRRREWQPAPQAEDEREDEHQPEPAPQVVPRRRSVIIRERIHKVKMAREQEIDDLVARTAVTTPSRSEYDTVTEEGDDVENLGEEQINTTDELEERIHQLEKQSDTWLSVLNPLLSNMTRTLDEMKKDGKVSPLLMGEFIIDIAAEARRSMLVKSGADGRSIINEAVLFENFDGAHHLASLEAERQSIPDPAMTVRLRKTSKGRSPARSARLRLPFDQSSQVSGKTEVFEAETPKLQHHTITVTEALNNDSPKTPEQHEFAAQVAVKKRIQEQEIMMDELMTKWGLSPCPSQESIRPAAIMLRDNSRQSSKIHSRKSSAEKFKRMERFDLQNGLGISGSGLQGAPMNKHWRKANSDGNRQRDSRRGSRRWSSAGERMSWKPGDSSFMNVLMQELRDTSRLSFEDRADLESLI